MSERIEDEKQPAVEINNDMMTVVRQRAGAKFPGYTKFRVEPQPVAGWDVLEVMSRTYSVQSGNETTPYTEPVFLLGQLAEIGGYAEQLEQAQQRIAALEREADWLKSCSKADAEASTAARKKCDELHGQLQRMTEERDKLRAAFALNLRKLLTDAEAAALQANAAG